ncbi:BrnT family toxin [Methylovulum miyakonense]|uniref:BrnT family toxin n=1 Tax=Methylovulum miyakonense TaxID=645578 RepID=UPI000365B674|nr:BrnT family toxin [Methylovulum miyakonense]
MGYHKTAANQKKHGVSFEEAKSVFYDKFAAQFYDKGHSDDEHRFLMLGFSCESSKLKKSVTIRLGEDVVGHFKEMSEGTGVPHQILINLYLRDCARQHRTIDISWQSNSKAISS